MPDDLVKYSDAIRDAEAATLHTTDVMAIAQVDGTSPTGYGSKATEFLDVANFFLKGIDFSSDLHTTSDNIIGAINETAGVWVSGTLTAGSTSLVLSDASITTTSTIDIYTDVFGIQPTNAVVTSGQIVFTFLAQASDITVKVRVS